jgi:hypothetical protein
MLEECLAGRGGSDATGVAVKQGGADLLFNAHDAPGERGLSNVQACRRAGELAGLGDCDDLTHVPELDRHMFSLYQVVTLVFDTSPSGVGGFAG